jgi:hypothetical protein
MGLVNYIEADQQIEERASFHIEILNFLFTV